MPPEYSWVYISVRGFVNEGMIFRVDPQDLAEAKRWAEKISNEVDSVVRWIEEREARRLDDYPLVFKSASTDSLEGGA